MGMIREIIRKEIDKFLIKEYAMSSQEFGNRLESVLWVICDNLLCISIYHTVNQNIIPHWVNRAKQLPRQLIRVERKSKVEKVVDNAYKIPFGKNYEDINVTRIEQLISYYGIKPKKERMIAQFDASYYIERYKHLVVECLEQLKYSLITKDIACWNNAVDGFVSQVTE